jgi:hypothetical protein
MGLAVWPFGSNLFAGKTPSTPSVLAAALQPRYLRFAAFPSQYFSHHLPPDCLHAATHLSMEKPVFVLEVL